MDAEQKKTLEAQTLVVIQAALQKDSMEILDTVRFARDQELFFPEMYTLWFRTKVAQTYFSDSCASVLKYRKIFGIDTGQASKIYHSITGDNIDKIKNISRHTEVDMHIRNITSVLNTGLFLEAGVVDYLERIYKSRSDSAEIELKNLKAINHKNYSKWLEGELDEKTVDTPKMKI